MSHATLIIDGQTRLDDSLDDWHRRPPELLAELVKPGAKPEPYLAGAAMALANATIENQTIHIEITTHTHGWTLKVDYP